MTSFIRNSIVAAVVLFASAALAGTCPTGPFHPCEPFSVSGVWYSDASKTTVVGGWWFSCPNVNTCVNSQGAWGQQTTYFDVDCEPCDPCGNCNPWASMQEEHDEESCILKAELEELEQAEEECGAV